jgi:hypothetical protein
MRLRVTLELLVDAEDVAFRILDGHANGGISTLVSGLVLAPS